MSDREPRRERRKDRAGDSLRECFTDLRSVMERMDAAIAKIEETEMQGTDGG